jgi:protein-tyrosine phosphatase
MKKIILLFQLFLPLCSIAQLADSSSRLVKMEGAINFRDLGNYKTSDNRTVLQNKIFRSAELSQLSQKDLQTFTDKHISKVIDFRGKREAAAAPDRLPEGTSYQLCPAGSDQLPDLQQMVKLLQQGGFLKTLYDTTSVQYFAERYRPLFQELLTLPDTSAILFHCTGGRDRTGMAAALLLYTLKVPMPVIEADFTASNTYLKTKTDKMFAPLAAFSGLEMERIQKEMELKPELLHEFFKALEIRYGSVDAFLEKGLGIGPEQISALRKKYTTK